MPIIFLKPCVHTVNEPMNNVKIQHFINLLSHTISWTAIYHLCLLGFNWMSLLRITTYVLKTSIFNIKFVYMPSKLSYYLTMTHKLSKTQIARLDSTRLLFTIFVQTIAIQLGLESSNSDYFFIGSYTNNSRSGEFLSNSEARSSYSPKFVCLQLQLMFSRPGYWI